jgi:Acetyltransferase (GNAT) domain
MNSPSAAGYLHASYAASLAEYGTPMALPRSGTWLLRRRIDGVGLDDAMGCYPLLACRDWSELPADFTDVQEDLVCVTAVPDPFGDHDLELLTECFDFVRPFKDHFVIDLDRARASYVSSHHRRNVQKALRVVDVEPCDDPPAVLDEWAELYSALTKRYDITGIRAFSRFAFGRQLSVPGISVFRATYEAHLVGMLLWYTQGEVAYYHLGAFNARGYELGASFALFWSAIDFFTDSGVQWLDLGAGAGLATSDTDGLSRFKRGWSTHTRTAYLCGRVFDPRTYAALVTAAGTQDSTYFPAYRDGEYGGNSRKPPDREAGNGRDTRVLSGAGAT